MTVPCVLHHQLLSAAAAAQGGGDGGTRVPSWCSSSPWTTQKMLGMCVVQAAKKSQRPTGTTNRREIPSPSTPSTSSNSKGGSVAEKPQPSLAGRFDGGKRSMRSSSQVSKKKGDDRSSSFSAPTSSTMEMDLSRVAALPGPRPPAGFILDDDGAVALVAPAANRIVTITDPTTQRPLECMIRRAFQSSDGQSCLLLLPLDMPLQILKIDGESEGLAEVRLQNTPILQKLSDDELQEVLPSAVYALAKRRLHLILSGFCLTARGGFCYTEEHVLDFNAEYGQGLGGSLTEGVEIANFQVKDSEYIVYTPFDAVMFVARRDEATGQLMIADDDLLDDDVVLGEIDEENEFQALVEEEDAIHETLREAK